MPSDDEIIIIENGTKPNSLEIYVNVDEPQSVKDELAEIAARSRGHISFLDKVRLFAILWSLLP